MTDTYVGTIDKGTTGARFVLFGHDGRVVGSACEKHEQTCPEPGWVEHDSLETREHTRQVVGRALDEGGQLAALGITDRRGTTLLWGAETGAPVHDGIRQDRRTTDRVERIEDGGNVGMLRSKTGLEAEEMEPDEARVHEGETERPAGRA